MTNPTTATFPLLIYRTRDGVSVDCVAAFVSRGDALTYVKAAHFPTDYRIYESASDSVIFDTNGMTLMAVSNWRWNDPKGVKP